MATVAEAIIDKLGEWGVECVFGLPGDSIDPIVEAIRRQKRVRFIQVRHEETGALAASAYAKLTGRLGVCLATAGPGAVHLLNGLYDAKLDHAPVLALTGQVDSQLLGTDYFQELDLLRLFADVAAYNHMVVAPEQARAVVSMAVRTALARGGVANLTLPFDLGRHAAASDGLASQSVFHRGTTVPEEGDLDRAAELLQGHERVVVLAGRGALHARPELVALAERLQAPVVNTLPAKGVIPDLHPLSVGGLGLLGASPAHAAMEGCDALLMVGTSYPYLKFLPGGVDTVQIDRDPAQIGKRHEVSVGLCGDARPTLAALAKRLKQRRRTPFLEKLQADRKAWWQRRERETESRAVPIRPQVVARTLQQVVAPDAVISVDVGNVLVWMAHQFQIDRQLFLTSGWLGTMACGLPGAIAARLAHPERQAVAVVGDGGFTMLLGDFVTAVKYRLPILVVVFNNSKLAMIKYEQEVAGYPEFGVDLQNPNFADYARACGARGYRVERVDELRPALDEASRGDGPAVVDVLVQANEMPLPPRIAFDQAVHYALALFRETFE